MFQLQRGGLQKIVPKMSPSCHHVRRIKEERNLKSIKILYLELFYLTLEISAHFYRRLPIFSPHSRYLPKSNAIWKLNFRQENLQHKWQDIGIWPCIKNRWWRQNFVLVVKIWFLRSYYHLILELLLPHHQFVYNINAVVTSNVSSKQ